MGPHVLELILKDVDDTQCGAQRLQNKWMILASGILILMCSGWILDCRDHDCNGGSVSCPLQKTGKRKSWRA